LRLTQRDQCDLTAGEDTVEQEEDDDQGDLEP
jgi:hypothetical protein